MNLIQNRILELSNNSSHRETIIIFRKKQQVQKIVQVIAVLCISKTCFHLNSLEHKQIYHLTYDSTHFIAISAQYCISI
jgi:hypothetical protein